MPLKYKIFEDRKLVYLAANGEVTYRELVSYLDELAADSLYQSPMKKLVDFRNVVRINMTTLESNTFALKKAKMNQVFAGEKCATVVTRDLDFGMARMHEAHVEASGIQTNVFRKLDEALAWLDVEFSEDEMILG